MLHLQSERKQVKQNRKALKEEKFEIDFLNVKNK